MIFRLNWRAGADGANAQACSTYRGGLVLPLILAKRRAPRRWIKCGMKFPAPRRLIPKCKPVD